MTGVHCPADEAQTIEVWGRLHRTCGAQRPVTELRRVADLSDGSGGMNETTSVAGCCLGRRPTDCPSCSVRWPDGRRQGDCCRAPRPMDFPSCSVHSPDDHRHRCPCLHCFHPCSWLVLLCAAGRELRYFPCRESARVWNHSGFPSAPCMPRYDATESYVNSIADRAASGVVWSRQSTASSVKLSLTSE